MTTATELVVSEFARLTHQQLLAMHTATSDALRERGIIRSANNPVGDLAEALFCRAFGWAQAPASAPAADAVDQRGRLIQIKARRLTEANGSRQVSALRGLESENFHLLAGVLFDSRYQVLRAALVPHRVVLARSKFRQHTNSHRFLLDEAVWQCEGVEDVTDPLRVAAKEWLETGHLA